MLLQKSKQVLYFILKYHCYSFFYFIEFFIGCVLLGLDYIHNNNIIHRDLKPENLVCDEKGYIRITDFGVAKVVRPNNNNETSGTPGYMAPEVLCSKCHSFPVDFFAIGVMGYEFMLGDRPYQGATRKEIKNAVLQKQAAVSIEALPQGWSIESADFINKLLKRKPEKRLGFTNGVAELKAHKWFKGFDWEALEQKILASPFTPDANGNFDKNYCEGVDPLCSETIARYQAYMQEDDYMSIFSGYTFINESEIQKFFSQNQSSRNPCDLYSETNNNNLLSTNDNSHLYFNNNFKKQNLNFSNLRVNQKIEYNSQKLPEGFKFKFARKENSKNPLILSIKTPSNYENKNRNNGIPKLKIQKSLHRLNYLNLDNYRSINLSNGNINNEHLTMNKPLLLSNSQSMKILPLNSNDNSSRNENKHFFSNKPLLSEKKFFNYNFEQNDDQNFIYSPQNLKQLDTHLLSTKLVKCKLPVLSRNSSDMNGKPLTIKNHQKKKMILPISINNSNFNNALINRNAKIHFLNKSESVASLQNSIMFGKTGAAK